MYSRFSLGVLARFWLGFGQVLSRFCPGLSQKFRYSERAKKIFFDITKPFITISITRKLLPYFHTPQNSPKIPQKFPKKSPKKNSWKGYIRFSVADEIFLKKGPWKVEKKNILKRFLLGSFNTSQNSPICPDAKKNLGSFELFGALYMYIYER